MTKINLQTDTAFTERALAQTAVILDKGTVSPLQLTIKNETSHNIRL